MGPITYLAAGSTLGLVLMTGLYLDKRDDLAQEIAACNLSKALEVVEAQEAVRVRLEEIHDEREKEWQELMLAKEGARAEAVASRNAAIEDTGEREDRIRQLTLEASVDEIPDSFECLNVYVPWAALDWVREPRTNCEEARAGRSSSGDQVCTDTGGLDRALPAPTDFSSITYSDAMLIWGRDRDSLEIVNGRLLAIERLSDTLVEDSN